MHRKLNVLLGLVLVNILVTLAWISFQDLRYRAELDRLDQLPRPASPGVKEVPVTFLDKLKKAYGPKLYSQFDEETLIRHFFKDMRAGFFVDVGAGEWQRISTTYYLEKHLDWKGIAIDANEALAIGYAKNRPRTKFFCRFVADTSDQVADFFLPIYSPDTASGKREMVLRPGQAESQVAKSKVPTITLNKLLDDEQVKIVDFLSMDIEGGEVAALAGFDIKRFKPKLVCIEVAHSSQDLIRDYFKRNGYQRVEEYLPLDPVSWFFAPAGSGRKVRQVPGQ